MNEQSLSQTLIFYRKSAGLSQKQVADAIGINRSTYAYYEVGKTSPKLPTLTKIATIYNISVDQLLNGDHSLNSDVSEYEVSGAYIDDSFLDLSDYEKMLVIKFRLMSQANKQELIKFLKNM